MSDLTDRLRVFACSCEQDENQCTACEVCDVLDAIDALHTPRWRNPPSVKPTWCRQCEAEWPCDTHLLIHPDVPA